MRRFRQTIVRFSEALGPALALVGVIGAAGLGFHAARDWHRHGAVHSGIFHLHFHVGDHHHDDHGHDHGLPDAPDHDRPNDRESHRAATFTIAQAASDSAVLVPLVAGPGLVRYGAAANREKIQRSHELHASANPRAPPV